MMIDGRDKETGLGMSEQNIKYNVRRRTVRTLLKWLISALSF